MPHRVTIEFAEQGSMMKTDPATPSFFHVFYKCRFGLVAPHIGRIVQLEENLILQQVPITDRIGVIDYRIFKMLISGKIFQPVQCSNHKVLMYSTLFGQNKNTKCRIRGTAFCCDGKTYQ